MQLVTAQQESAIYSQYMIKSHNTHDANEPMSTGDLLEQAYARNCLEKPRQMLAATQKPTNKASGLRTPDEVANKLRDRYDWHRCKPNR